MSQAISAEERGAAELSRVTAVARANAEAVDRDGRFPSETIEALRAEGMLSALIPARHGGGGHSLRQAASVCHALGRCCASSAMVLAMHHIQVACLVAHSGDSVWLRRFLGRVASEGMLLASVTSEASVGGSMRTSLCAVETGVGVDSFALTKHASTVSYGAYSGGLLVTARAHPDARDTDQVLVVVPTAQCVIEQRCAINTMGMRGTASESFVLRATGSREQIMPIVFSEIAAQTMTPVSHLLWAALWCGIAADAVTRARAFLKGLMRSNGGAVPDRAARLVQAVALLQAAEARVRDALISHERSGSMASFAETASINTVKTGTSEACLAVAEEAMLVCGFAGYSNEGRFSISRHLRDLHSARLMVHNDRIRDNTARLLLMQTPRFGVD